MYGWERGPLGCPTTDETSTPDNVGRYNHFSRSNASTYWTYNTAAHAVEGRVAIAWAFLGWERGRLGYPTSNESAVLGTSVQGSSAYFVFLKRPPRGGPFVVLQRVPRPGSAPTGCTST